MPSLRQSTKSQKKTLRSRNNRNNRNKRSTLRQKNRRVNRKRSNKSRSLRQKRRQQGGGTPRIHCKNRNYKLEAGTLAHMLSQGEGDQEIINKMYSDSDFMSYITCKKSGEERFQKLLSNIQCTQDGSTWKCP